MNFSDIQNTVSVEYYQLHNHSDYSNLKLLDSINRIEDLIETAHSMGSSGVAITEHEFIGSHYRAIKYVEKRKKYDEKSNPNPLPKDFKLILGNEIYLVESVEWCKENYSNPDVEVKFFHYLLLAKNAEGHLALRKLSSQAWKNSFRTGLMDRTPTEEHYLEQIVKEHPNSLVATSACMGGRIPYEIMKGNIEGAKRYIEWNISVFGKEDFYLELQPATYADQITVNKQLVQFANEYGLKTVVTSDSHYARPEDAAMHEAYLNAKEGDREVADFYGHTYMHTTDEIFTKMEYLGVDEINKALQGTVDVGNKIEEYSLDQETIIPRIKLPEFKQKHLFKKWYPKYEYIEKMSNSKEEQDRYLMHLIEEGFLELIPYDTFTDEKFQEYLARIDVEVGELWKISQNMNQAVSSYYVTTARLVDILWGDDDCGQSFDTGSIVGYGRGSAVAFLINYLMKITMVNPLEYGLDVFHWRHINAEMGDISALDIDIDINAHKRPQIFKRLKEEFGEDSFLQVATFGTEASKSAIKTTFKGMNLPPEEGDYLASLVPFERGSLWTVEECLYGNEKDGKKPIKQFVDLVDKHENLRETLLKIQGLVNKRSTHAGGVIVLNSHYTEHNALMKSPDGSETTQFDLGDTQQMGAIKMDLLSIEALTKIQENFNYLLEDKVIEKEPTLRQTFYKYFHPDVIDTTSKPLFELASSGTVQDLFQFSTAVGYGAVTIAKPKNLIEMVALNSIMRLKSRLGEAPLTTFAKFKEDINLWYEEMKAYNLSVEEVKIMEDHLLHISGIADTQESAMLLTMDERISGFDKQQATFVRKTIGKPEKERLEKLQDLFFTKGREMGASEELLKYVWEVQLGAQLGYSFSVPHVLAYSLMALLELNLNLHYNPLYWQAAVLNANSGSIELEDSTKKQDKDYGKVAKAVSELQQAGINIRSPLINIANYSFTPNTKDNSILFALKAVRTISDETAQAIVENRPYTSFEDFYDKMYKSKILQAQQMVNLIKAGAFTEFEEVVESMKKFILGEISVRDKLNGQNTKSVLRLGLLDDEEFIEYKEMIEVRERVSKKKWKEVDNPKDTLLLIKLEDFQDLTKSLGLVNIEEYQGDRLVISKKEVDANFAERIAPLYTIYNTPEFLAKFNSAQFKEEWNQRTKGGDIQRWAMDALTYYPDKHELHTVPLSTYGVVEFTSLDANPEPIGFSKFNGREYPQYEIGTIAGTVIDKDNAKHTVTLLTKTGVVTCKFFGGTYSHYNKEIRDGKTRIEDSWFRRGNLLMISGYRRQDQWVNKKSKSQKHSVSLIRGVMKGGELSLQNERYNE